MVESVVLRLRRLRAAVQGWIAGWLGHAQPSNEVVDVVVVHQMSPKQKVWAATRRKVIDAMLLATMLGTAAYAPISEFPWLLWMVSTCCAGLLGARGVDWIQTWSRVFVPGRTA